MGWRWTSQPPCSGWRRGGQRRWVAGALPGITPPAPLPRSWAARADADVAIWTITLAPGATFTLPPANPGSERMLYFFDGRALTVGTRELQPRPGARLRADVPAVLTAGAGAVQCLVLQGRPIGEPVAQHGPFVMNTAAEIQQAFADYRRTGFGGWPWPVDGPVHARERGRFARYAAGRVEDAPA